MESKSGLAYVGFWCKTWTPKLNPTLEGIETPTTFFSQLHIHLDQKAIPIGHISKLDIP